MLNKKLIGKNFSRAAQNYQNSALVQKQAAHKLYQLASPFVNDSTKILDLGCGSGFIAQNFSQRNCQFFEVDLSLEMLKQERPIKTFQTQCDFTRIPFRHHSFDVLISSFSLQWLENFEQNFAQFANLLKSNGIFAFCVPTANSLSELRTASIESGCNFNFHNLPENSVITHAAKNCGFREIISHQEIIKSEFVNGLSALKSIKETGANYSTNNHSVSKTQLTEFNNFCLKNSVNSNKNFAISWNVSFFIFEKSN